MQRIQLYRSADLFVLPSFHTEGFPTVILEASSVGLPLIYTPQGRLADLLTLENGLAIDVTALSGESLAEAIWELYQDPDRREAMSTANRELAQQYSVEIVCQQLENTYLKVTSGI